MQVLQQLFSQNNVMILYYFLRRIPTLFPSPANKCQDAAQQNTDKRLHP